MEEGKVSVLAKLLFVNGNKKRKLADMQGPPERGPEGQVILRFGEQDWCGITFAQRGQNDEFAKAVLGAMPVAKRQGALAPPDGNLAPEARARWRKLSPSRGDDAGGGLPHWEEAVRAAVARARTQSFTSPLPASLPSTVRGGDWEAMSAAGAWKLVAELCAAWEAADARRDEAKRKAVDVLVAERDENMRARKQVEDEFRCVDTKLQEAEANVGRLERKLKFHEEEAAAYKKLLAESQRASDPEMLRKLEGEILTLKQRLKEAWTEKPQRTPPPRPPRQQSRAQAMTPPPPPAAPPSEAQRGGADMACAIAEFEAAPLRRCPSAEERAALRKRLLLKWHPDKQPSAEHAEHAKRVMQELQNLPDWQA